MNDTRQQILEKNYDAIRRQGFQGTRTDRVIEELGVTKGAFYHYFRNKHDLGYAVVDEIIAPHYLSRWRQLDRYEDQPIDGIIQLLEQLKLSYDDEAARLGCPLNNLIQEMSPLDAGFRERLAGIIREMHGALTRALERAANNLQLSILLDEENAAHFILASIAGSYSIAKSQQSRTVFNKSIDHLIRYVRSLKR